MLSILIPTRNFQVSKLVRDLRAEAINLGILFEIVVGEDGSSKFVDENSDSSRLSFVKHIVNNENIGRAKMCNLLASMAKYRYLLFLDADSEVIDKEFLKKYLPELRDNCVINGGLRYRQDIHRPDCSLRLLYGQQRESATASVRQQTPHFFTTFNFLIDRELFSRIKFDESITEYGYEDLVLGYELYKRGVEVRYIDNPLYHTGIDTNEAFIRKTECAINNLSKIYLRYPDIFRVSRILSVYRMFSRWHITSIIKPIFFLIKSPIKRILLSRKPSLFLFDIYKLGLLVECEK